MLILVDYKKSSCSGNVFFLNDYFKQLQGQHFTSGQTTPFSGAFPRRQGGHETTNGGQEGKSRVLELQRSRSLLQTRQAVGTRWVVLVCITNMKCLLPTGEHYQRIQSQRAVPKVQEAEQRSRFEPRGADRLSARGGQQRAPFWKRWCRTSKGEQERPIMSAAAAAAEAAATRRL